MPFKTWWVTYKLDDDKLFADWGKDAWDAGRAESEAEIAALKTERDALREALLDLQSYYDGCAKDCDSVPCECVYCMVTRALSIPVSGEKAAK